MSLSLLLMLLWVSAGAVIVARDWRFSIPALMIADLARILLSRRLTSLDAETLLPVLPVELVATLGTGLILLITGVTLTRELPAEQLDEFAQMELRRAARESQRRRAALGRWNSLVVPVGALVLAALATWLLSRAYPIARDPLIDAAWIFMLLTGLLALITATDALKLGLGLLLILMSAKLLYFGIAARLNILHIGLLELLSLLLALIVAYLSGLLYGRLRTLDLGSLFGRMRDGA
jgi:hypothetical protein